MQRYATGAAFEAGMRETAEGATSYNLTNSVLIYGYSAASLENRCSVYRLDDTQCRNECCARKDED
jgi:hypothetical protein